MRPHGPHAAHVAVLPYHHDPCQCCHTGTISGPCVAIPARCMPVLPYRHYLGTQGAPRGPRVGGVQGGPWDPSGHRPTPPNLQKCRFVG